MSFIQTTIDKSTFHIRTSARKLNFNHPVPPTPSLPLPHPSPPPFEPIPEPGDQPCMSCLHQNGQILPHATSISSNEIQLFSDDDQERRPSDHSHPFEELIDMDEKDEMGKHLGLDVAEKYESTMVGKMEQTSKDFDKNVIFSDNSHTLHGEAFEFDEPQKDVVDKLLSYIDKEEEKYHKSMRKRQKRTSKHDERLRWEAAPVGESDYPFSRFQPPSNVEIQRLVMAHRPHTTTAISKFSPSMPLPTYLPVFGSSATTPSSSSESFEKDDKSSSLPMDVIFREEQCRALANVQRREMVSMLCGPAGSGKTLCVERWAQVYKLPIGYVNCSPFFTENYILTTCLTSLATSLLQLGLVAPSSAPSSFTSFNDHRINVGEEHTEGCHTIRTFLRKLFALFRAVKSFAHRCHLAVPDNLVFHLVLDNIENVAEKFPKLFANLCTIHERRDGLFPPHHSSSVLLDRDHEQRAQQRSHKFHPYLPLNVILISRIPVRTFHPDFGCHIYTIAFPSYSKDQLRILLTHSLAHSEKKRYPLRYHGILARHFLQLFGKSTTNLSALRHTSIRIFKLWKTHHHPLSSSPSSPSFSINEWSWLQEEVHKMADDDGEGVREDGEGESDDKIDGAHLGVRLYDQLLPFVNDQKRGSRKRLEAFHPPPPLVADDDNTQSMELISHSIDKSVLVECPRTPSEAWASIAHSLMANLSLSHLCLLVGATICAHHAEPLVRRCLIERKQQELMSKKRKLAELKKTVHEQQFSFSELLWFDSFRILTRLSHNAASQEFPNLLTHPLTHHFVTHCSGGRGSSCHTVSQSTVAAAMGGRFRCSLPLEIASALAHSVGIGVPVLLTDI